VRHGRPDQGTEPAVRSPIGWQDATPQERRFDDEQRDTLALAAPKVGWWWTGLLLRVAELALGVWAVRSWQRSLLTLVTLVGVWAIFHGATEIFAAFTLREAGKRAERLVG
jgi:Short repeat of unknown function (DUF308)